MFLHSNIYKNQPIIKTKLHFTPLLADDNLDGKECLSVSKLIKESEEHIIVKSYFGFYALLILCNPCIRRPGNCLHINNIYFVTMR